MLGVAVEGNGPPRGHCEPSSTARALTEPQAALELSAAMVVRLASTGCVTCNRLPDDGFFEAPLDLEAELGSSKGQLVGLLDRQGFACRPNGDGFSDAMLTCENKERLGPAKLV